jgi:PAS domain S-box-containing protein
MQHPRDGLGAVSPGPFDAEKGSLHAALWSQARDAIFVASAADGRILDANPAACTLLGRSRDELIGGHHLDLHPESERRGIADAFRDAARRPGLIEGYHVLRSCGEVVPVEIVSSETVDSEGRELLIGRFREIRKQVDYQKRLLTQNWALQSYSLAAVALMRSKSAGQLMKSVCEAIVQKGAYLLAWIGIAENEPAKLVRVAAAAGVATGYLEGLTVSWSADEAVGRGPTGQAIRSGKPHIMSDSEMAGHFLPWQARARTFGIRASASLPFSLNDGSKGALMIYADQPAVFEPVALDVFQRLAEEIAFGLDALEQAARADRERAKYDAAQRQTQNALEATIGAVAATAERRDPYTAGHQIRVADIAHAIGRSLSLSEDALFGLRMAALVHDIGKIGVPIEILTKPKSLTETEFSLVREHPEIGYDILKDVPFPWPIATIVRQHHERIDGSGYPQGLEAPEILPESKILAVADVVEAMASFRPYRPALGIDVALAHIETEAGSTLDRAAAEVCSRLFREGKMDSSLVKKG